MTAEANTEWRHDWLTEVIDDLRLQALTELSYGHKTDDPEARASFMAEYDKLRHAASFIEFNMKEAGIDGGNGDE